jgi:ABC-type phosphate transport system substrate-binding protein
MNFTLKVLAPAFLAVAGLLLSAPALSQASRDYVYVVGSSTVYPFATVVAERFGRGSPFKTPKIESTGTGGGLKLFCDGIAKDQAVRTRRLCRQRGHGYHRDQDRL